MRAVDLAVYADVLAGRAATLAAELERARDDLGQAAIERDARRSLAGATVERLEKIGVLGPDGSRDRRAEIAELASNLAALEELQAWVEERLLAVREEESCAAPE